MIIFLGGVLCALFIVLTGVYYPLIMLFLYEGEYSNKRVFILDLIPLYGIFRLLHVKFKKLD